MLIESGLTNFDGTCAPCHEAPGVDRSAIGRSDALIEQLAELRALEEAARRCASQAAATLDELTQGEQEERHRRSDIHESDNHEGDTS